MKSQEILAFTAEGLDCLIVKRSTRGDEWLTGYVVIPEGHPLHGEPCLLVGVTFVGRHKKRDPWMVGIDSGFEMVHLDVFTKDVERLARKIAAKGAA